MFLLDINITDIDSYAGNSLIGFVGSNIFLAGGIILLLFMYAAYKMNIGGEATLIIGAFLIFGLVGGLAGAVLSGLLPSIVALVAGLIVGIIIALFFLRILNGGQ